MSKAPAGHFIRLKGVRQNNLKNFDLDLPIGQFIVITGLSGSGKSSLAFDTLYAEGQRRYIETFSPYARQFFDRMDKPKVDSIQGIPPAIAIEQRNSVKSTRSTVGTMTELCEYMKVLWTHLAQLHCRNCQKPVRKAAPQSIWRELKGLIADGARDVLVTFEVPLSERLSIEESLGLIAKQGYQRIVITDGEGGPETVRVSEAVERVRAAGLKLVTVVQDRLKLGQGSRIRFIEACEQAYHFGKGKLAIFDEAGRRRFSNRWHCAQCDLEYREPTAALFSFNHPLGACPTCRGFGRTITIDYDLAIPDRSLSLADGAVKPWQGGQSAECQADLMKFCRQNKVPVDVPFKELSAEWQRWVVDGDPSYASNPKDQWPHAWYGVKGYFRWLESKAYKMHVRVLLSRYRAYQSCPDCAGRRFQPEALLFKRANRDGQWLTLADFYQLPATRALQFVQEVASGESVTKGEAVRVVLNEVISRLSYLCQVGLGYLTLDRPTRSLSGGETERVNLTTCLGSRLVNTLFVLDEPSVGLHPRDTARLITILERLRQAGNTVVVVEHEPSVMRAADQLIDLGPGHGEAGGELVFQGSYNQILRSKRSLTGRYLQGDLEIKIPVRRPVRLVDHPSSRKGAVCPALRILHAKRHNLKDLHVSIPLERLVCVTGVSGSGKTTLIREVLWPALKAKLGPSETGSREPEESTSTEADESLEASVSGTTQVTGWEGLGRVLLVDQSSLGKTPRSNPAVYIGAFEHIRELFAQSEAARRRGLNASAFSFNSAQGQCEQCRGAGFEKVEMQFLSDIYIRCPACQGRRYREFILEVKISSDLTASDSSGPAASSRAKGSLDRNAVSISDLLEATVDEVVEFLNTFSKSRSAARAGERLKWLQEVGLGYLRLGQPINTLSGGESQRLKLVSHLAEFTAAEGRERKPTLFLFDEPTTGLHFADVQVLLGVFQRLVAQGHSVLVIEHNLDLIKCADWVLDLGPEAGEEGGWIVAEGSPEQIAQCAKSHTGQSLRQLGVRPG